MYYQQENEQMTVYREQIDSIELKHFVIDRVNHDTFPQLHL